MRLVSDALPRQSTCSPLVLSVSAFRQPPPPVAPRLRQTGGPRATRFASPLAPAAAGIPDAEQHGNIPLPGLLGRPGPPVDGVVGVLEQVRGGGLRKSVGHTAHPRAPSPTTPVRHGTEGERAGGTGPSLSPARARTAQPAGPHPGQFPGQVPPPAAGGHAAAQGGGSRNHRDRQQLEESHATAGVSGEEERGGHVPGYLTAAVSPARLLHLRRSCRPKSRSHEQPLRIRRPAVPVPDGFDQLSGPAPASRASLS